ncbi:MAG: TlpA disulfide reductase family protein [Phycisphaerales bacterium]|nr:TlpA disulfide reductase family protein [Phycisphaerales bacterium]MDG2133162.1 TlpA disulfide reductase family protein [Phycisphaerales bacterium]
MPESIPVARDRGRLTAMLAAFSLPLSLFAIGGLLGLAALALASRDLRRNPGDRRAFASAIVGLISMFLGGVVATFFLAPPGSPPPTADLVGTTQTEMLQTLDGAAIPLASNDGRVTLVDVWATWCPPCIASIPTLEAIHRDLSDQVRVVSYAAEPRNTVVKWLERRRREATAGRVDPAAVPTYPIATRDGPPLALAAATRAYPTLWIIDAAGVVRFKLEGMHDLPTLLSLLRMAEKPAPPSASNVESETPATTEATPTS